MPAIAVAVVPADANLRSCSSSIRVQFGRRFVNAILSLRIELQVSVGRVTSPSPSARARLAGGRDHIFHDRSLRRIHALFDAIALTADQRQHEDHDRQNTHRLISQTDGHRSAICGRRQGRTRESSPEGLANQRIRRSMSSGLRTQTSAARVHYL